MKKLVAYLLSLPIVVLIILLNGFVLSKLWLWFATSTFEIPALSLPQSVGFSLLVSFVTNQYQKGERENYKICLL